MNTASPTTLTIGSRGSDLALWQARHVAGLLAVAGIETRIAIIKTTGDHLQTASLTQAGGKGLFTKEIEVALLAGDIDLAVHSLKDLPTDLPAGLVVAAVPLREDPRDALVGKSLNELAAGARVGTSSGRRAAQLLALRPDLRMEPIRGNVDTRLRKLKEGQFDAIMLAAAGLRRLGLQTEIAEVLAPEIMCPAPGQGALALQTRAGDHGFDICCALNDPATSIAVDCERAVLAALGGGCQLPVGAFARVIDDELRIRGVVAAPDGSRLLVSTIIGNAAAGAALGARVADDLLRQGAREILACLA